LGGPLSAGAAAPTSGNSSNSRISSIACGESDASFSALACLGAGGVGAGAAVGAAALLLNAGFATAAGAAFGPLAGAGAVAGALAAARAEGDARSGASSSTGATATGVGTGASALELFELARRRTAIFCMIVRTWGLTIRSRTPSLTDFRSARIMATPTRSPWGARTGRKIATRPSSRPFS